MVLPIWVPNFLSSQVTTIPKAGTKPGLVEGNQILAMLIPAWRGMQGHGIFVSKRAPPPSPSRALHGTRCEVRLGTRGQFVEVPYPASVPPY